MKKNIVILGAGFGGLHAAMLLGKKTKSGELKNHKITLIDKNEYHTYTPTLYEVSTTSKEVANYIDLQGVNTFPIEDLIRNLPIDFLCSKIVKIDLDKKSIHLSDGRHIPYSHLIISLGSQTNYFKIPGLKENSLDLKTFHDAIKIRDKVWNIVSSASKNDKINIVIGGGGPTGVELAGELQAWLRQLQEDGYNCKTKVKIVDAAPNLLGHFDKRVIKKATNRLNKMGTNIVVDSLITKVSPKTIKFKNGKTINYDVLIWTGGVKPNNLTSKLSLKTKDGQIEVNDKMVCSHSNSSLKIKGKVYAIGDNICIFNPETGHNYPGVARAAIEQAGVVAKNIVREDRKEDLVKYHPLNYPYIIPVGAKYAIAKFGPFVITGFLGWVIKGIVELTYLLSIMSIRKAVATWIVGLKIFIQNDRLG